jgi:hypothetical protein
MKTTSVRKHKHAYLVSSGDLRLSASQKCWPEQAKMEAALAKALESEGWTIAEMNIQGQSQDRQIPPRQIDAGPADL